MGILNVTPDSFSDGGEFDDLEKAMARAKQMVEEGAEIIDIGGEATGPTSEDVSLEEELDRVIPVVEAIKKAGWLKVTRYSGQSPSMTMDKDNVIKISVDTSKYEVAKQAIEAGADMINDIMALRISPEIADLVGANPNVQLVLMYSKDPTPRTTKEAVQYEDVVQTIKEFLKERIDFAKSRGVKDAQIIIDPGMGAFVSGDHKYSHEIIDRIAEFKDLDFFGYDYPVLIGHSRKGFTLEAENHLDAESSGSPIPRIESEGRLGALSLTVGESRVRGTLVITKRLNESRVVDICRVHDVKENRECI